MKLKPRNGFIVVKLNEQEAKTESGLHIPEEARDPQQYSTVMAVPEGYDEVKVGETVLMGKFVGLEVEEEGVKYLMVQPEEILGVVEEA